MADTKDGREDQADRAERRQREREIAEALARSDEPEPPVDEAELDAVEAELDALSFPATAAAVVETIGDHTLESPAADYVVADLVPDTTAATFASPAAVRSTIQRPTVASAMRRVVEAAAAASTPVPDDSRRVGYEKTFRALAAIDADDDDEGVRAVADWIVERIREDGSLPDSRAVRQEAAAYCRANGYAVRDDEWLGA